MNVQQLQDCAAVLGEMSSNFLALPTDRENAVQAGTYCLMAQTYVLELANHLIDGMEPYDAFVATAKGEQKIPESKSVMLALLAARPKR